ncbi:putative mitochondrial hypothetical protein [Leptomonas pyrrhocoris]|uniref:Defective in cullin neddylation protein n=1 Tax=Leptomonas pyrrhocoris TaxID=157538 RepID=A0A0M9G596_LEPPY|nr:putative mitochondrial hypothetical protein [Leptomonas pyrrhocoris]XP_015661003.1 putative mitochondrial hypothetical protein [Leptomonas pyrrhocoris]KPA82563.1 putative mitochondrial hypothetical protein [Leptomonas pyrrhocoris]KPA82564.1 putative mitochondrial hypothetical protein [Leptomonas pyrrhocoris]|eukprot:XP_015661002.1 putative mitochondrial hypothetical protein [Leptomonas pyrrhocoris]
MLGRKMVTKATPPPKSATSPRRDRGKPVTPSPQTRASPVSPKLGATQFHSKGARSEMELHFDRYCSLEKSSQTDSLTGRGLTQFLSEIAVSPFSFEYYVVLWKLSATQNGCILRLEWVMAMYTHGVEFLSQLKIKTAEWVKEVRGSGGRFLLMYNFLYDYIRGEDDRCMSLQNATTAWDLFFEKKDLYVQWKPWAADHVHSEVSRDLWRQVGVLITLNTGATKSGSEAIMTATLPTVITDFLERNNKTP